MRSSLQPRGLSALSVYDVDIFWSIVARAHIISVLTLVRQYGIGPSTSLGSKETSPKGYSSLRHATISDALTAIYIVVVIVQKPRILLVRSPPYHFEICENTQGTSQSNSICPMISGEFQTAFTTALNQPLRNPFLLDFTFSSPKSEKKRRRGGRFGNIDGHASGCVFSRDMTAGVFRSAGRLSHSLSRNALHSVFGIPQPLQGYLLRSAGGV